MDDRDDIAKEIVFHEALKTRSRRACVQECAEVFSCSQPTADADFCTLQTSDPSAQSVQGYRGVACGKSRSVPSIEDVSARSPLQIPLTRRRGAGRPWSEPSFECNHRSAYEEGRSRSHRPRPTSRRGARPFCPWHRQSK